MIEYPVNFVGKTLPNWQSMPVTAPALTNGTTNLPTWVGQGREQGSAIADPFFVNAGRNDFRLKSNSPALALGFKPFDYSKAGGYGYAVWRTEAKRVVYPPREIAAPPSVLSPSTPAR